MNNKKIYIILGILSIIFLGIGGTFAFLTTSATATNITQIKSGNLTMTIDGGGNANVSFMPSTCTSEYAIKKKIVATATNTSGGKVSFSIGMNIATLSSDFKRSTMKYALTTVDNSCTDGLIASGNLKKTTVGSDIWIVKNDYDDITLSNNKYTKTYYLYIWLDQSETKNLSGTLSINMKGNSSNNPNLTTEALIEKNTLYDYMEENADTTTTIDFSKTSEESSTNGIYMTTDTDSGNPVYYYRGNVDNNVIFANYCWKIIRTTETGGVKLIYNGVPSNGECNNTTEDTIIGSTKFSPTFDGEKYVGYMYGDSIDDAANTTDSTIKTFIDTWYQNNMTSYTSQLEDTVFCNDRSYTTSGSYLYFGAYTRLFTNKQPTLKCQNARDKFTVNTSNGNGDLTYPVGLITADEVVYAGGVYLKYNSSYYLYNNVVQWTISPWHCKNKSQAHEFVLYPEGRLVYQYVHYSYGARPVVSLQPGIGYASGSGTASSPYVVNG